MREGRQRDVRRVGEIHKFIGFDDSEERIGDGRSESMGEVACELQQKDVGTNVQSATRVHVSEACEGCWPSAIGNHAIGGEVEGDDVRARRRCEDPGSMENVGVVGDLPKGCEGADAVEIGRSRRELREPPGEGDIVHIEQGRPVARSEGNSSADGARQRQWK